MPWPAIRKTVYNDSISHLNSRPKLPFPGNGKLQNATGREGKFKACIQGKREFPLTSDPFYVWLLNLYNPSPLDYASSSSWPLIELPTIYNLWLLLLSFLSFDNAFYICRWIITQTFFDVTRNTTVILFIRKWIKPPNLLHLLQVLRFLILIPFILLDFCSIKISRYRYNSTPFAARIFLVLKCKVEHIFLLTGDSQTRGRGSPMWEKLP